MNDWKIISIIIDYFKQVVKLFNLFVDRFSCTRRLLYLIMAKKIFNKTFLWLSKKSQISKFVNCLSPALKLLYSPLPSLSLSSLPLSPLSEFMVCMCVCICVCEGVWVCVCLWACFSSASAALEKMCICGRDRNGICLSRTMRRNSECYALVCT